MQSTSISIKNVAFRKWIKEDKPCASVEKNYSKKKNSVLFNGKNIQKEKGSQKHPWESGLLY